MPPTHDQLPPNVLTVDVEDWYQLVGLMFAGQGTPQPALLERQLDRILGLLAEHRCCATFFCLGVSLVDQPHLVRRIAEAGHEVASHGWAHQKIHEIGLDAFREDLRRSLAWLEDLLGTPVAGYRAPAFSVAPEQLQGFYDICFECGLQYDSSAFPIRGRRYGIPTASRAPAVVREEDGRRLVELPLATLDWLGRRWPIAGGGHWRLLPKRIISAAVRRINREGLPLVTYVHPYEFDAQPLSGTLAAAGSKPARRWAAKQNLRRRTMYGKLNLLLGRHRFTSARDYLHEAGFL